MTKAVGLLNIVSGVTHLLGGIFILIFGWLGDGFFNILWYGMVGTPLTPITQPVSQELQSIVAIPVITLSIMAIIAGIFSIKRRKWMIVLIGSICGTLLTWFLGLPAILFTILSKNKFQQPGFTSRPLEIM
ncbi:hypothetical protein ACFLYF_04860 [Chloroflexota bacterium]